MFDSACWIPSDANCADRYATAIRNATPPRPEAPSVRETTSTLTSDRAAVAALVPYVAEARATNLRPALAARTGAGEGTAVSGPGGSEGSDMPATRYARVPSARIREVRVVPLGALLKLLRGFLTSRRGRHGAWRLPHLFSSLYEVPVATMPPRHE